MFDERLNYVDKFPFVVGRIKSFNEIHVIPILKDHILDLDESEYLNEVDFTASITNPEKDVTYLSLHSFNRFLTRVMVVKVYQTKFLDVFNIDDLEFETIEISSMKPLPNSLQKFNPIMTIIKLFNIECCNEICEDPSVVSHRIMTLTHHKRLYAVIRQFVDNIPVVDIYEENYTNLIYQELIDEGYFVKTNEALVEQLSTLPTEIEKYDIVEHDDQKFVCVFKYLKEKSTHPMIFPLIDQHVDNMTEMETTLKNLVFRDLPKITEQFLKKFCIVYSPISRRCYRGKIITENYQKSCVKILFIDENITDTVSLTFIRQIPPELMLYKSKLVEVSLHNFPFKKDFEKEMTRDLIRVMKNKKMNVLIRAFDDEGIPIVDLYKTEAPVLIYQEILDKFAPLPMIEDTKTAAGSVDETNSFKKEHSKSVQSYDEEFLCTFAYTMGPYEIAIYPINDTGSFVPEEIRTTSSGLVNAAYLKKATIPDFDTCYYACVPGNTSCYLSKIVNFDDDENRLEIHLLEFHKFMFVQLEDLFVIPDLQIEGIVVTLNFRFDPKFDELIEKELNEILKNQRINVVIRDSDADNLLVVDMYEVGSNTLIYQKLIDKIIDLEKEEMKQKSFSIIRDVDEEVDLITFDDVSADEQTFEQQKTKRIFLNGEDVILKSLGVGVFSCLLVDFQTFYNFQVLPLINTYPKEIEPLEVQVKKFQSQELSVQLYKVKINKDLNLEELEDKFCLLIGDQTLTAVVRDCDDDGIPFVELYGRNPFILAYQDFIDDGSFIVDDPAE